MENAIKQSPAEIKIEKIREFKKTDLHDICDASESTMRDDSLSFSIGSNREDPLVRERLENYWKGVLLVPERELIVGRVDGTIAASLQILKPSPNNQTSNFAASVDHHFVAPWARGYGLAKMLINAAEVEAKDMGIKVLKLNVRANLANAIQLYEASGYKHWGTLDKYEMVDGEMIAGHFYYKDI